MKLGKWFLPLIAGLLLACPPLAGADELLDRSRALIDAGNAEQAYQLLAPFESERAGEPEFDHLLGRAALHSGRPGEALFALERVIAMQPDNARARLDYARAYQAAGLEEAAERELEAARGQGATPDLADAIEQLMGEILAAQVGVRRGLRGYLGVTGGFDTNVNGASDDDAVSVGGVIVQLDERLTEQDDVFLGVTGGLDYQTELGSGFDLIVGGRGFQRWNLEEEGFDFGDFSAYFGLTTLRGRNEYTGALQLARFRRDNDTFRDALGFLGRWRRVLDRNRVVSAFVRYSNLDYDEQPIRDADRYLAGMGYVHGFGGARRPVISVQAYGGTVDEEASGVPHLGYDVYGVAARGRLKLTASATLVGTASAEFRSYGGPVPGFTSDRDDDRYHVSLGVDYRPLRDWRVTPSVAYTHNNSNTSINDYDRTLVSITVRREFK